MNPGEIMSSSTTSSHTRKQATPPEEVGSPPKKKAAGRKPADTAPLTHQQALNRANGRAFRDRQKQHLAGLERQVAEFHQITNTLRDTIAARDAELATVKHRLLEAELEKALASSSSPLSLQAPAQAKVPCQNCAVTIAKLGFAQSQLVVIQTELEALKTQQSLWDPLAALSTANFDFVFGLNDTGAFSQGLATTPMTNGLLPISNLQDITPSPPLFRLTPDSASTPFDLMPSISPVDLSQPMEEWLDLPAQSSLGFGVSILSAEQKFGELRVEFARYSLKTLEYLKNDSVVDIALDSLLAASRSTDKETIRKHLVRAMAARFKILMLMQKGKWGGGRGGGWRKHGEGWDAGKFGHGGDWKHESENHGGYEVGKPNERPCSFGADKTGSPTSGASSSVDAALSIDKKRDMTDHMQAHRIFDTIKEFNAKQVEYMLEFVAEPADMAATWVIPSAGAEFYTVLKGIESFKGHEDVVEEYCAISFAPKITPSNFLRSHELFMKLKKLLPRNSEDGNVFWEAIRKWRFANKEEALRQIEEAVKEVAL